MSEKIASLSFIYCVDLCRKYWKCVTIMDTQTNEDILTVFNLINMKLFLDVMKNNDWNIHVHYCSPIYES